MGNIPIGHTKEDIKAREQLIKDFYAQWIAEHPEKKVWNRSLGAFINVKYLSINETYEKASRSYESTLAVFRLTEGRCRQDWRTTSQAEHAESEAV